MLRPAAWSTSTTTIPAALAEHTAFNVQAGLDLAANYRSRYGLTKKQIDDDLVIASAILHDALKPWCLQWKADGTLTIQASVGGTASHHPFVVAEALFRKLSPKFIVALAAAHEPPGTAEAKVVDYIRAAGILSGVDPVAAKLLDKTDEGVRLAAPPSYEASINHLSDHDYVLTDPASTLTHASLGRAIVQLSGGSLTPEDQRWKELEILTRINGMALYAALEAGGDEAVLKRVKTVWRP